MRIQLLPESHMFHGHAIPPGIPLRGEMPACQKEKSLVGMGTDLISILELFLQHHWQRHSEVRTTCSSRTGHSGDLWDHGERKDSSAGRFGGKNPNQPTNNNRNQPKTKPQRKQQTNWKATSQSSPEGDRSTWQKWSQGHLWGHPYSCSSSARDHFMTRLWGFSGLTQNSED